MKKGGLSLPQRPKFITHSDHESDDNTQTNMDEDRQIYNQTALKPPG